MEIVVAESSREIVAEISENHRGIEIHRGVLVAIITEFVAEIFA